MTQYFEFKDEKSAKFWQITQKTNAIQVRFGKIGTNGQTSEKNFDTAELAQKEYNKLIKEKTGKGYLEMSNQEIKAVAISNINAHDWIENLIAECIAFDSFASQGEPPMFYTAFLKEYSSIQTIKNLDKKFIKELTFEAIKKFKEVVVNTANADKIKNDNRKFFEDDTDKYYEWLENWIAKGENPNRYGYSSTLVEDCLCRFINHLIRWYFDFTSQIDFVNLFEAYEFEVYSRYNDQYENEYWKFPISLTLGKLNLFASYNTISNDTKAFLESYPRHKKFNLPTEDWTLESAEVFFESIQDKRIAKSTNGTFYNQSKIFSPEVKTFLYNLIEEALLEGNPDNRSDFCKLTNFSIIKTLAKKSTDFKIELADLVYEQMIFFAQNSQARAQPYLDKNAYVQCNVLDKLFTALLKTHIPLETETDFVGFFQKFNVEIELTEKTIYGFSIFSNQVAILIKLLTQYVEKNGMSSQLSNFLRDVVSKFVKLKGVLEIKTIKTEITSYTKQVAETGKIKIEFITNLSDWYNIADNVPLINGKLYNIGFFLNNVNPENLTNLNWQNVATDLDFLHHCKSILKEVNCMKTSMTDSDYLPFILHKTFDYQSEKDYFDAFGIIKENQINSFFYDNQECNEPEVVYPDFFDDENELIEQELEMDEDADVSDAQARMEAYEKVNELIQENRDGVIHEFGILAGYDRFPVFKFWKSKTTGHYIGFLALVSDRYIYE
jgi:predicted DNA-binding WGR domain protein